MSIVVCTCRERLPLILHFPSPLSLRLRVVCSCVASYNKFLRAKKVKGYSAEDLRSILGVAPPPQAQPGIKLFGVDYPEEEEQAAKRQRIEEEDAGPRTSTTKEVYVHGDVETQKVEKAKKDKKAKKEKKKEKKGK